MGETVTIVPRVEMMFGSDWVDVSDDVVSQVEAAWGIHGANPKQRIADPGTMRFQLDNSNQNSGGLRGYYTPGHPDARVGFDVKTPVRFVLHNDLLGDKVRWVGTVEAAKPGTGVKDQTVDVSCVDWLEEAARSKLSGLDVQVDIQSDVLFELLVAAADTPPPGGTLVGTGSDVYEYALDNVQDEKTTLIEALNKLLLSEFGLCYVSAGVAVFEGRRLRSGGGSIRLVLDEDDNIIALATVNGRDEVINHVLVSVHPRRVDPTYTVLFNLGSSLEIVRGTEITISCPYRDQNQQAQRVGGLDMQDPDAGEGDYTFNAAEDGSGKDLTEQLTVTAVFGGNSAAVTIANNGPNDGFVPPNGIKLRGIGLYDFEPVIADRSDSGSITAYGECPLGYDMPYQSDPSNAGDLALFILALNKTASVRAQKVTFVANWSDTEAEQAFHLEVSDRVSVTSAPSGLAAEPYFVNGLRLVAHLSGLVTVQLDLAPTDTAEYWQLEVDGRTELDETTVLGYGLFTAGWILDSSELGSGTFLN